MQDKSFSILATFQSKSPWSFLKYRLVYFKVLGRVFIVTLHFFRVKLSFVDYYDILSMRE